MGAYETQGFKLDDSGKRIVVDPVTRIEGHMRCEVNLDSNNVIRNAVSTGTMWRGLEVILKGRDPRDAWAFVERICGVCTGCHALTSVRAVEDALGIRIPKNAHLIREMMAKTLQVHDHAVHFYHLHALDWVDVVSALKADPKKTSELQHLVSPAHPMSSPGYFRDIQNRLRKFVESGQLGPFMNGYWGNKAYVLPPEANLMAVTHYLEALDLQKEWVKIHTIFGGKNPHPNYLVGGVPCAINIDGDGAAGAPLNMERLNFVKARIDEIIEFNKNVYVPDVLASGTIYKQAGWLYGGGLSATNVSDYGEYPKVNYDKSTDQLPGGVILNGNWDEILPIDPRDPAQVQEFVTHSWYTYADESKGLHPWDGVTEPHYELGAKTKGTRTNIEPVSQSVAAARALASAAGVEPPPNGRIAVDLMLATENLADHLTHFYLFFMPDFAREVYGREPWFAEVRKRFEAGQGEGSRAAIAARQRWFQIIGTLGGKWPHTHSVMPGGSTRAIDAAERLRLLALVREFRAFLERHTFGAALEEIVALADEGALEAWHAADPLGGDLRLFLTAAASAGLHGLGRGPGRYLSHGNATAPAGLWDETSASLLTPDLSGITEDLSHAWMADDRAMPRHPAHGVTRPDADKPGAYTWNKAPRLAGRTVETGAVARCGGTVYTRVLARLLELAEVVPQMERWLAAIQPREPFCSTDTLPDSAEGCGLAEAARGALGHWLRVERGRIASYQIVAPTSWNFSPRDAAGNPGPLEAALVGTPVREGERTPVAVQHVVRSFDPCMVCTVH